MAGGSIIGNEPGNGNSIISQLTPPVSNPTDAVIFFGLCLLLGLASRQFLSRTRVPYTVTLLIIGIIIGFIEYGTSISLGNIGNGVRIWAGIDPDLLLAVFLPVLLFDSAFSMELEHIKGCMAQMLLLAVPGVVISTFCIGSALKLTFPYNWSWKISFLLGGLLSATDPVAVLALLKELGGSKKLSTIIEGESMMNDGIAIVLYQLFLQMVLGENTNAVTIIRFLAQNSFGAVGIGIAFGVASVLWLGFIYNEAVMDMTLTLAVSYTAYLTGQVGADVSGILTVMSLGMFSAIVAKIAFKGDGLQSLHHFWELVADVANTVIFILRQGLVTSALRSQEIHGAISFFCTFLYKYLGVLLLWFCIHSCAILVLGWTGRRQLSSLGQAYEAPLHYHLHYLLRMPSGSSLWIYGFLLFISNSSPYSVHQRTSASSSFISPEMGTQFVFFSGGIVFLTLFVNGSTTQFFLNLLGMVKLSDIKKHLLEHTKYAAMNDTLKAFGELRFNQELGQIYWSSVKKYITIFKNLEEPSGFPHSESEATADPDPESMEAVRVFLLSGVQSVYQEMLEKGWITQVTADILKGSVLEAKDLAAHEPLCDWEGLKANVHFPSYCKVLQSRYWPQKLVAQITVNMLGSACCICAAFLCAHRVAEQKLLDLLGHSDVVSTVINESEAEGDDARAFLDEVRTTFPQVLHVVNLRRVTHSMLNHLMDYFQNLKVGLLEEPEIGHLCDTVQTDLKRLLRNPPLVNMPRITDMINAHPLLGSLPSSIREPIVASIQEVILPHGVPLYGEGSNPNGVWFISNGVVKGRTECLRSKYSYDPTFTHASTLGLYEVLVGKPYICNMIADTRVHGFYVESAKILSALKEDSTVEDFLWQESAIVLAKLLLPQVFGRMEMRDLSVLVAERSTMATHNRGETIGISHHSAAILLEGIIKFHGSEELITSPAALSSSNGNHSFPGTKATSSQSGYQVEARARVIIFDVGALQAENGLMTLPANLYKQQKQSRKGRSRDEPANRLAARAMRLSIFGSLIFNKVDLPGAKNEFASVETAAATTEDEEDDLIVRIDSK